MSRRGDRGSATAELAVALPVLVLLLLAGLTAVKGDLTRKAEFALAIGNAKIDSPRGAFTLSRSHNPVQDIYLRKVVGKENKLIGVASKALADPGLGCQM